MEYVINFQKVGKQDVPRVGGKNASLGEMINAGIRVPPGFAVTTESYLKFITDKGLKEKIFSLLSGLDPEDVKRLNQASDTIQEMIKEIAILEDIRNAIIDEYGCLCKEGHMEDIPVAVRSSATAEDLPTASFAGQQDTYLWIKGCDDVIDKVQCCWASLFTPRAISYRIKNRFPHDKVLISVGVQKMVNSRSAGVMFTLNPTDGDLSKVVIESSWGLGETVVSGDVTPDKFVIDKILMEASEKVISRKHIEAIFDDKSGKVITRDVPEDRQQECSLEDKEILELVRVAKEIEKHYGMPMDIEWAIDRDIPFPDNIFIVQARPETVWSQKKKESVIGGKSGYQLLMEQAMKRIKLK